MTRPSRRDLLRVMGGAAALPAIQRDFSMTQGPYTVGIGTNPDPYRATIEAITAAGRFPSVSGRTVIIKPNLVAPMKWDSGVTTHPLVTHAVVELGLAFGTSAVKVVEIGRVRGS